MRTAEPYTVGGQPIPAGIALLLGLAVLLMCFLLAGVAGNLVVGAAGYSTLPEMLAAPGGRQLYRAIQGLSNALSWGLPALLWAWYVGGTRKHLGLSAQRAGIRHLLAPAITLAFLPLAAALIIPKSADLLPAAMEGLEEWARAREESTMEVIKALLGEPGTGALLLNVLVVAVIPAVAEELFFRGMLLGALRRMMPLHIAVWLGAVIFSLVHFQFYGFFARVMLGAVLGYLYLWSGDLRTAMLGHFMHNLTNLVLVVLALRGSADPSLLDDDYRLGWLPTLAASVVAVALLYVYFRRVSAPQFKDSNE